MRVVGKARGVPPTSPVNEVDRAARRCRAECPAGFSSMCQWQAARAFRNPLCQSPRSSPTKLGIAFRLGALCVAARCPFLRHLDTAAPNSEFVGIDVPASEGETVSPCHGSSCYCVSDTKCPADAAASRAAVRYRDRSITPILSMTDANIDHAGPVDWSPPGAPPLSSSISRRRRDPGPGPQSAWLTANSTCRQRGSSAIFHCCPAHHRRSAGRAWRSVCCIAGLAVNSGMPIEIAVVIDCGAAVRSSMT
jgi:hypothetical protein